MLLSHGPLFYILKEIGISPNHVTEPVDHVTLEEFFEIIVRHKRYLQVKPLKKLYDEFVRDVIKEDRVRYRILEKGLVAQERKALKTVTVTSRFLMIYEDDDNLEQPQM